MWRALWDSYRGCLASLGVSWTGTLVNYWQFFVQQVGPALPVIGTLLSAIGTVYAIRLGWLKARAQELENARREREMCETCRTKSAPPPYCPIPPEDRPADCRIKNK